MSHERLDGLERGLDEASRRFGFALVVSAVVIGSVIGLAWAVSALRPRKPRW